MKEYMKDLVYKENPFLALVPKNESPDGFAGKYIPVPLEYGRNAVSKPTKNGEGCNANTVLSMRNKKLIPV